MDLLSKDEIWATEAWSGRIATLQQQGVPVAYLDPKNSMSWMEHMQVLQGAPITEYEELINFMLEPATSIAVTEATGYHPSLDPSTGEIPDRLNARPALAQSGSAESR